MQFRRLVVMLSLAGFLTLGGLSISPSEALAAPATKSAVHKKSGAKKAVGKKSTAKARKTARTAKNTRSARLSKIKAQKRSFARKPKHRAPSMAMRAGLRKTPDPLELSSSVAYMVDQDTGEVFFGKNSDVQLPIASVTKLMTALVIMESGLSLKERLTVDASDYVNSSARSKLFRGMRLTRGSTLTAALMSSDNRAAHMLARTYPGGHSAFVAEMNEKAQELGMTQSHFSDSTGLSNENVSTAHDLALLAAAAHQYEEIRTASTRPNAVLDAGRYRVSLQTTNRLIGDPRWNVGLQKTGFTTAAGRCMVVQSEIANRRVILVVLDSATNSRRADDMYRMRTWLEQESVFEKDFAKTAPFAIL